MELYSTIVGKALMSGVRGEVASDRFHIDGNAVSQELQLGPLSVRADKPLCRSFLHRTVYTGPFLRFPRISCFNHRASILTVAGVPESQVWAGFFRLSGSEY